MIELDEVIASYGDDDPARYIAIADHFLRLEDRHAAAAALDRAHGLLPDDPALARHRAAILDELAVTEHGIVWRYVPAGTFLMGSTTGDPDERPVHPRRVAAFWIAETPLSWAQYCAFAGWEPPPEGMPPNPQAMPRDQQLDLYEQYKIRMQYCEDDTAAAGDWHVHAGLGTQPGTPIPSSYTQKPIVAVSPLEAEQLAAARSTPAVRYALPTEAQWEKAARGGLVGKRYAWGDAPPAPERCDFDHMGDYRLAPLRGLPANGYGLRAMCGSVAEWTADLYDALAYQRAAGVEVDAIVDANAEPLRVLRGGSWCDCAAAVTVSFRASRAPTRELTPTVGVRLVRVA